MECTLAIDPGTHVGWAISKAGRVFYGSKDFTDFKGVDGRVHSMFLEWLRHMIWKASPTQIVIEQPFFRGANSQYLYGFSTLVIMLAYEKNIAVEFGHLSHIKKHITGSGSATKEQVITAIKNLGYSPEDDHTADAIALLHFKMTQNPDAYRASGKVVSIKPRALNRIKQRKRAGKR